MDSAETEIELTPLGRLMVDGAHQHNITETREIQAECYRGDDYLCPLHGRHYEEEE